MSTKRKKRKADSNTEQKKKGKKEDTKEAKALPLPLCYTVPQKRRFVPQKAPEGALGLVHFDEKKWFSGKVLRYCFVSPRIRADHDTDENRDLIREAFEDWNAIIGVNFKEVTNKNQAEIRIGFQPGFTWSAIGTEILDVPRSQLTMNYGWDLSTDPRTKGVAVHEIGHTLDFPHEHQNPKANFKWDVEATLDYFRRTQDWEDADTHANVLDPLPTEGEDRVTASKFDVDSIMGYGIPAGLITSPTKYRSGLPDNSVLSATDKKYAALWYPKKVAKATHLEEGRLAPLAAAAPKQTDFKFSPTADGSYTIHVVGNALDVKILLSEGGTDLKARYTRGGVKKPSLTWQLEAGKDYLVQVRVNSIPTDKTQVYAVAYRDSA